MTWTDARISQLEFLWHEGYSANEIAKEIGVSRNSVTGKARRLGLISRPSPILRFTARKFIDLGPRSCRRPLGELMEKPVLFCGADTGSSDNPFCQACSVDMYDRPKTRAVRERAILAGVAA